MTDKKLSLGGSGQTVRHNLKRLRGGMQYKELSERLTAIGRPIPTLGLRRIEAGERRVDADDLVALAVVFGVSPLSLLLPPDGSRFTSSELTGVPGREVSHNTQWLWGLCREPLEVPADQPEQMQREIALFQNRAVPQIDARARGDLGDAALGGNERELLRATGFGKDDDTQGMVYSAKSPEPTN